jgi:hypothetical protein
MTGYEYRKKNGEMRNVYKILVGKTEEKSLLERPVHRWELKCKGKFVPILFETEHHAMKAYKGSGCIAPSILDLGARWRRVVSFTSRPLYPQGKSTWCPLDRRLGGS